MLNPEKSRLIFKALNDAVAFENFRNYTPKQQTAAMILRDYLYQLTDTRDRLAGMVETSRNELQGVAQRFEDDPLAYGINTLGFLQSRATSMDVLVGAFDALRRQLPNMVEMAVLFDLVPDGIKA